MYSDDELTEKCNRISQHARLCKPMYNHDNSKKSLFTVDKLLEIVVTTLITYGFETILKFIIKVIMNVIN